MLVCLDFSSNTSYRSILDVTSLAHTRAGQSECRVPPGPITTPERSSRLSVQRQMGSAHRPEACIARIHVPTSLIGVWPSSRFDFGRSRRGWGLYLEEYKTPKIQGRCTQGKTRPHSLVFYGNYYDNNTKRDGLITTSLNGVQAKPSS